mgnify:CR=1 FL=1
MEKAIKIYYATPITGAWGDDAPKAYVERNCGKAVKNLVLLRQWFPDVEWYSPAENDTLVQVLFFAKKLSREDILWADCEIIKTCDGLLANCWETSDGVEKEVAFASEIKKPTLILGSYADFDVADGRITMKQIEDFICIIEKAIEKEDL